MGSASPRRRLAGGAPKARGQLALLSDHTSCDEGSREHSALFLHRDYGAKGSRFAYAGSTRHARLWRFVPRRPLVCQVPRTVFIPAPSVDSVVLELKPRPPQVDAPADQLFTVIRASFQQRRKTVRNALKAVAKEWGLSTEQLEQALLDAKIDPTLRGERLSLEDYSRLTGELLKGV